MRENTENWVLANLGANWRSFSFAYYLLLAPSLHWQFSSSDILITKWAKTSLCGLLPSFVPSKEGKRPRWTDIPLSVNQCDPLGLIKLHGLPKTPDLFTTVFKETFFFLFDTMGFGVTTSRTVTAPLKGVVKDTQWSWSSVLIFKHVNGAESAEVTLGVTWDYYYLYECNAIVASVFDKYSVG